MEIAWGNSTGPIVQAALSGEVKPEDFGEQAPKSRLHRRFAEPMLSDEQWQALGELALELGLSETDHAHWLDACQRKLDLCQSAPSTTPISPGSRKLFLTGTSSPTPPH